MKFYVCEREQTLFPRVEKSRGLLKRQTLDAEVNVSRFSLRLQRLQRALNSRWRRWRRKEGVVLQAFKYEIEVVDGDASERACVAFAQVE